MTSVEKFGAPPTLCRWQPRLDSYWQHAPPPTHFPDWLAFSEPDGENAELARMMAVNVASQSLLRWHEASGGKSSDNSISPRHHHSLRQWPEHKAYLFELVIAL